MAQSKQSLRCIAFLPGIAWFLFVLVLLFIPVDDVPEKPEWFNIPYFDKMVHAGLFGGIVFWFCMPFKKSNLNKKSRLNLFIKIALATIIWGITTEYMQKFFTEERQFDIIDWVADSAGVIIAFFISRKLFL